MSHVETVYRLRNITGYAHITDGKVIIEVEVDSHMFDSIENEAVSDLNNLKILQKGNLAIFIDRKDDA